MCGDRQEKPLSVCGITGIPEVVAAEFRRGLARSAQGQKVNGL